MMQAEELQSENAKSLNSYIFIRAENLMKIETLQFIMYSSVQLRDCWPVVIISTVGWNMKCKVNTPCLQDQVPEGQLSGR